MRRLTHFVGLAVAVGCCAYFVVVGVEHAAAFPVLNWNSATVAGLAKAIGLLLATMIISGVAWHIALCAAGEPPKFRAALAAVLLPQIAKYVPGNVAHFVGRAALAHRYGFALPRVILTMTFETGWAVVAAAGVAVAALLVAGPRVSAALPQIPVEGIALVVAAALAAPAVGAWLLRHWRPRPLARLLGDAEVILPGFWPTLACFVIYSAILGGGGLALDILAQGALDAPEGRYVLLTGVFAVAWVAGYIIPGAPGGLGVREAILVAALGPVYGEGTAVALAIIYRVCSITADGLAFLIGLILRRPLTTI